MARPVDVDFTEFVQGHATALLRTAYLLTGDQGYAEDLVQTALAKVYVSWTRIREPAAIEAYARRVLVNTAMSWWRQRLRRGEHLDHGRIPELTASAGTDEIDERARVWALVRNLPLRQRAVIVLRYYEDLSESETADVLGCATGTVKSQTHRALGSLRRMLDTQVTMLRENG